MKRSKLLSAVLISLFFLALVACGETTQPSWANVGHWNGTGMQNTEGFTVNQRLRLTWQCTFNQSQPFGIQVWQHLSNGTDTPIGQSITGQCQGGMESQVFDFSSQGQFQGFLGITALADWTIDAYTSSP